MPRNSSGVYTLPAGNPVVPGTTIDAAWANDTMEDMANELTNSLSRTGAGGMLAPFRLADGSVTAPGVAWLNETNSGLYRSGAGSTWMSILGVNVAQFSTVGLTIPSGKAFTAQGNASVSGTFGVTGATTLSSTLAVTGAITATGGVVGNVTGNVTAASGTSSFNDVTINGSLDMVAGSSATITGLSTPVNASDAANKGYVDAQVALKLSLTGGTMSGNIAMGGNLVTGLGSPSSGGDATNKTYVDGQVATRLPLSGGTMTGALDMNNYTLGNVATPTAGGDAANKTYVDSVAQGLDAKASCKAASVGNLTLSGAQIVDGAGCGVGDRVLVKNQTSATQNGIYVVSNSTWTRATDADTWNELIAAFTFVEQGTVNGNSGWVCTAIAGGTLGVTAVNWVQFSGAGQIDAGTGMTKTGNTLNVNTASASRIVVNADDIDLATTGVTGGTYRSVTVDAYGRVTAGTNPTTLAGYGITDAYTTTQVDTALALKLNLTGGTMSGAIAMGSNKITGLGTPTNSADATTKTYVDTADALKLNLTGGTMSGAIAMGTSKITGLGDPTNPQDAATKNYIDTIFGSTTSAAASAAAAASSASTATTQAGIATTQAGIATTQATNAATTYTNFNNQYLGDKSSDPTVNNTGGALVAGNLYWNSTVSEMRVYNGSSWVAAYIPAAGYLALSGGTMTGVITFASAQTFDGAKVSGNISGNAATATYATSAGSASTATSATTAGSATTATTATNVSGGTASVTTLTASSTVTLSAGTAQNIPYLNASKELSYNANFVLDTSGNLGVGTSAPKLRVQWSAASAQNSPTLGTAQGIAYLTNNDANYGLCIGNSSATGAAWFQAQRTDGTATAYDIVFNTAGGNVGVGVATPQAKLDLSGDYKEGVVTANTSTAYTISLASGTVQILTLTGNCTFTFPTATSGKSFILLLKQDGTGSRTVTWPAAVKWPGGTAPTITSTASKLDKYIFTSDGTNWYGSNAGQNYTV